MYVHLNTDDYCGKLKKFINEPFAFKNIESFIEKDINSLDKNVYYRNELLGKLKLNKEGLFDDLEQLKNSLMKMDLKHYRSNDSKNPNKDYYLDFLIDYFEININGESKDYKILEDCMSYVQLSELVFHIINNDVEISFDNNIYNVYPTQNLKNELKRRWFALQYDKRSQLALTTETVMLSESFEKHKSSFNKQIEMLKLMSTINPNLKNIDIENEIKINTEKFNDFLDNKRIEAVNLLSKSMIYRVFILHIDFLENEKNIKSQYFIFLHKLCKLFALLSIENTVALNYKRFIKFGIDKQTINKILDINSALPILDKGFDIENSKLIYNEDVDIYNVLKTYMIKSVKENKLSDLTAKLGLLFESYVRKDLEENIGKNKFDILPKSIDYNENDVNVDIDIVVYDNKKDLYYFIQCKYTINNKPYYKDEIKSFCHNKLFKKGLKQLSSVNKAILEESFLDELKLKGVKLNQKKDNFVLILVHTSAQLDFQQIGDVVLYEWNTLRNLFDDGKEFIVNANLTNPTIDTHKMSKNLQLGNIDSVMAEVMEKSSNDYLSQWESFFNQKNIISFDNLNIQTNIK
ncbi:hypothetical protein ACOJTA_05720 [Malaciobacter sp. WC5094]